MIWYLELLSLFFGGFYYDFCVTGYIFGVPTNNNHVRYIDIGPCIYKCSFLLQELVAKSIESSELNFSRYGDTFFEVQYLS